MKKEDEIKELWDSIDALTYVVNNMSEEIKLINKEMLRLTKRSAKTK